MLRAVFLSVVGMLGWLSPAPLAAQSNVRLLLESGWGVPGHSGFVFGPFSGLAMNARREIVFLTAMHSARSDIPAVIRSDGVSFSVVAFQGLRSPVAKTQYDSFSAPSINDAGTIAFTATLHDHEESPTSAVFRSDGQNATAIANNADDVPGMPGTKFQEFSAPLINSQGNILFAARWEGKRPGTGLFLWSPTGLQALDLPSGLKIPHKELLVPIFFSHDEAMFVIRGTPQDVAIEQFFRAVAVRTLQETTPPPDPAASAQILPPAPGEKPIQMVLVLAEAGNIQTVLLPGDPTQPVMIKHAAGSPEVKSLGRMEGQTTGDRGNIIFAATLADQANDLALYCLCQEQLIRETTPEEFQPITLAAPGKPILSLASDSQQTVAFIAPGAAGDASAIYVATVP